MKIPAVRILDTDGDFLAEIDTYTSLYLKRNWQGVGEFQLVAPANAPGVSELKLYRYIMLDNDGHRAGIIRSLQYSEDDREAVVSVNDVTLNGLAAQRITVPSNDVYNGGYDNVPSLSAEITTPEPVAAETILKTYVARHLAQPEDPTRRIPMTVILDQKRGMKTVWMTRYERLDTVLQKASEYCDMGWEIYLDEASGLCPWNGPFCFPKRKQPRFVLPRL